MRHKYQRTSIFHNVFERRQSPAYPGIIGHLFFIVDGNVKIDPNQNIILAGFYKDSLSINGTIFTNPGYSIFTAKLDPAGNLIWARNATMPNNFPLVMIAQSRWVKCDLDATGNIYVAGTYYSGLTAGNLAISSPGNLNGFLLKYDSNGNAQWLNNSGAGMGSEIAVTESGEIYISPSAFTATNGFLHKYNTNGILEWTKNTPRAASSGRSV